MKDLEVRPTAMLGDDDRPTEIHDPTSNRPLHTTREQLIVGSTIADMIDNPDHLLSQPLAELFRRARADLPAATIDSRATLELRHEFEFDRRVGYELTLKLYDVHGTRVEVRAQVDQDGNKIRSGSLISKLMSI